MQEKIPSWKWRKWSASLTMIALPTIVWNELLWEWCNLHIPADFFEIGRGAVFTSTNAITSFLLWWQNWKKNFFCFHITQNKFSVRHIPGIMLEAWQSPHLCMDFNHLRVVLIIYYKCMHLLIHFNAGVTQLHLFPFSAVPTFQKSVPVTNSSRDVW